MAKTALKKEKMEVFEDIFRQLPEMITFVFAQGHKEFITGFMKDF